MLGVYMSGKRAKMLRRQAKAVQDGNWTDEIPHPADGGEPVSVPSPGVLKQGAPHSRPLAEVIKLQTVPSKVPATTVEPLLLSIADVCALLNVSRTTIHRLEKSGGLPGRVMLGGHVRYHRETIEKWVIKQLG